MKESPIYSKTYDLVLWLIPQVIKFPREHRFGLGERVTQRTLDFQETIIAAGLRQDNDSLHLLHCADIQLAQLRHTLRICKDLKLISIRQYEHVAAMLVEIGRLLGGWQKKLPHTGQAEREPGGARRFVEQQSR